MSNFVMYMGYFIRMKVDMNAIRNLLRKINFKGKGRLVKLLFPKPFIGVIPYKQALIEVNTNNMIEWSIYWFGGYEDEINWVLPFFVDQDSTCIDIGANIGVYSVLLARTARRVISIEPHPEFADHLRRNINLNRFNNVELYSCAVSTKSGSATLYAPNSSMANKTATLKNVTPYIPEQSVQIQVKMRTLDSICESEPKVDFIKIDCDWYDADIILSGIDTIRKHRPVILFEDLGSFPENWDKSEDVHQVYLDAYEMLEGLGYQIFKVLDHSLIKEERKLGMIQNMLAIPFSSSV
jgi:FkbM family methyltransferase